MTIIKICGIKTLKDAISAIEAGADMLGFNFYSKSPRYIEKNACAEITSVLKKDYPQIKLVGVFVNSSVNEIKDVLQTCSLDLAQLHGNEPPEMLNQLKGKAFKALSDLRADMRVMIVDIEPAFLIDAKVEGMYGGSGITADWQKASIAAKEHKFLLAGGLTPENVVRAVRKVKPWGVDVASGVESSPGVKDEAKISAFIKAVREVENQK